MVAALAGRLELVKKLRARGADVNQPGWTALIYAATGGHDEIVRYLLAEGADIDAGSPNGTTALMMAAREGRLSTLELLIARGAKVNHRNQSGASALDWAKRGNERQLAERCAAPARRTSWGTVGSGGARPSGVRPVRERWSRRRRLPAARQGLAEERRGRRMSPGSAPANLRAPLKRFFQKPNRAPRSRPRVRARRVHEAVVAEVDADVRERRTAGY